MTNQSAKRVNIVSLKLMKESSILYKNRSVRSPEDVYQLLKQFLGDVDREYFVVVCLDTKNQPTAINICHIGSLNASIVHPRECFKPAILSNAASILVGHIQAMKPMISIMKKQMICLSQPNTLKSYQTHYLLKQYLMQMIKDMNGLLVIYWKRKREGRCTRCG